MNKVSSHPDRHAHEPHKGKDCLLAIFSHEHKVRDYYRHEPHKQQCKSKLTKTKHTKIIYNLTITNKINYHYK